MYAKKLSFFFSAFILCVVMLTACGSKSYELSPTDLLEIHIGGDINGEGKAIVQIREDDFIEKLDELIYDGQGDELDLYSIYLHIYDSVDYDFVGESENLSNGDTVALSFTWNAEEISEDVFGDFSITFNDTPIMATVEGLAEPTVIDVFDGVEVTYSGTSPNGKADVVYSGNDDFIKNNVRYSVSSSSGLSNGDTVTVTASCYDSVLSEYLYVIEEYSTDFTVSGLDEIASDITGKDLTEIEKEMYNVAEVAWTKMEFAVGETVPGARILDDENILTYWIVNDDFNAEVYKKFFYVSSDGSSNKYTVYYKLTFTATKDSNYGWMSTDYEVGAVEPIEIYFRASAENIVIDSSGNVVGSGDISGSRCGFSTMGYYQGYSFDEILSSVEESQSYTTKIEIE